jgi:hypothetical protein
MRALVFFILNLQKNFLLTHLFFHLRNAQGIF